MIHKEPPEGFTPKFEVVSCYLEHDDRFLLLRRQDHKPQGDTWGVPAGKIDAGESPHQAMVREMHEETGYRSAPEQLSAFGTLYVCYPEYDFVYHMFSEPVSTQPLITINLNEHKEYRWVTKEEAETLPLIGGLHECTTLFYNGKPL